MHVLQARELYIYSHHNELNNEQGQVSVYNTLALNSQKPIIKKNCFND